MNELFARLGLLALKPALAALVLPPVPLLVLVLLGAWVLPRRRRAGWTLVLAGLAGLWLMCTPAVGGALLRALTQPPPALAPAQRHRLADAPRTAIVVLGAGRRLDALEYGEADLKPMTLERLRYALWLARATRLPVFYTGGVGRASPPGPTEAEIAQRIAERDFGLKLRWTEDRSRDTRENAAYSVPLLHAAGIEHVIVVTHDFHQRRALADFERALRHQGVTMRLTAAPVGVSPRGRGEFADWLPGAEGFELTRLALHEWLGWLAGA